MEFMRVMRVDEDWWVVIVSIILYERVLVAIRVVWNTARKLKTL
ncbi:hypothetical protein NCCP691_41650 [Noviherbaspirillum aridicola]|uniref:Transmembrane protein n=1 Tax=Noviherbaspirillum aridicola TaxID=2849687 RepID=A0ABQ4QA90_9BURK|nr:hypothetical protein NCCP691_41650 [Noviherbaspirillum aridicola]